MDFNKTPIGVKFYSKTIMAIDFGKKFTGISLFRPGSDLDPYPYGRIAYKGDEDLASEIIKIIKNEFIEIVVLGLPHLTDGQSTTMTKTVEDFGQILRKKLDPTILLYSQDETLSTFEAKDRMQNSARYNFKVDMTKIDEVAASIILEDFLKSTEDRLKLILDK